MISAWLIEGLILLVAAVVLVPLASRLGLGAVLGYLAAGILVGPSVLGLITDVDTKLHLAELGVVLMLFVIGLELRPARLVVLRRLVFVQGTLQIVLTTLALWPLAFCWLGELRPAFVVAAVLSLSSTAIGLQMLAERRQLTSRYGRHAFGILLMQDIAVVPMLILLPLFVAPGEHALYRSEVLLPTVGGALVFAGLVLAGRWLLRPFFRIIVASRVHEIFIAAVLLVALGAAAVAGWAGMSMGLGAFVAGVLLSESEFRHELEAAIEPFKGLLLGLFFVAVGMTIDFSRIQSEPLTVLALVAGLLTVKFGVLLVVARIGGLKGREALSLAFALPQAGEFGFVLFKVATGAGVLTHDVVDPLIVAITISMALTPLLYWINERWVLPRVPETEDRPPFEEIPDDHGEPQVIIAGLGRVGQIVARNLSMLGIHFTALDYDHVHVDFVRRFGHQVYYGNANRLEVLRAAGAAHAKLFVLTISDIEVSLQCARLLKHHFPELRIHARARNRHHALELMALGVDYVIRETWLSSLELARETLRALGVHNASRYVDLFREHDERVLAEQVAHRDDLEAMAEIDLRSRKQLAELFEEDRSAVRASGEDN